MNFMSKMMFSSVRNPADLVMNVFIFALFAFFAWSLLSKPKKPTEEKLDEEINKEGVKVKAGTAILVYLVDTIIVLIVLLLPSLIGALLNVNSTVTTILGLLGWLQFILAIVLLPGPKRFQRMMNKRGERKQLPDDNCQ